MNIRKWRNRFRKAWLVLRYPSTVLVAGVHEEDDGEREEIVENPLTEHPPGPHQPPTPPIHWVA